MKNTGFFTKKCSLIVLLLGLLIGITIIIIGFCSDNNENIIEENKTIENKRTKKDIENDIYNIKEQINTLNKEKEQLINEREDIFKNEGFSNNYDLKGEEIILKGKEIYYLQTQLNKYEDEIFFIDEEFDIFYNNKIKIFDNGFFNSLNLSSQTRIFILGAFIILFTLFSYACIMHGYRRRELIMKKNIE